MESIPLRRSWIGTALKAVGRLLLSRLGSGTGTSALLVRLADALSHQQPVPRPGALTGLGVVG
jgi:hypothetical protein